MSFDAFEESVDAGQPIRLYQFARGALLWSYTSSDRDVEQTVDGVTYLFQAVRGGLSDDGIRQTGQAIADALVITAPASLEVAALYRGLPPSAEISLTIWDKHVNDDEVLVSWVGSIAKVSWPQVDRCKISCESLSASMENIGLRLTWQRACPHSLGDRQCRVDLEQYKVESRITAMDGASITIMPVLRAFRVTLSTIVLSVTEPGVVPYIITIENLGNVELPGVAVVLSLPDDSEGSVNSPDGDTNADAVLDVGETWTYMGSYVATETDIAAGSDLVASVIVGTAGIVDPLGATATTAVGETPAAPALPVTTLPLAAPALPAPTAGGFVLWYVDGEPERRGIKSSGENVLGLLAGTAGLSAGETVWVYPGCPGTISVCQQFENTDNYGGILHLPGKSPFDGNPIF